ncbi:MAG TPA: sigma-70 family RNA polymerase sigma factor [Ilumatobacteraceae bacterium]|nr:sigma-70 family RNA polymerase sigma factor [Ilumatobacteraceae bacterium]
MITLSGIVPNHGGFSGDLEAAKRGDEAGLSSLFRTFHPRVLRYLRAREPGRADDIAGETWVAVAAQIHAFDGDVGAFTAWLFTIARQRLADDRRTRTRRQTHPVSEVPDEREASSGEEMALENTTAQQAVDFIVAHLTRDQADVVLLRVLGDLNAREVAAVLGRDENWVRVTHHRAIARLKARASADWL